MRQLFLTLVVSLVSLTLSAQGLTRDIINFSTHNGAVYEQHVVVEDGVFTEFHWIVMRTDSITNQLVVVEESIGTPKDEIEVCEDKDTPGMYWFDQEIIFDGYHWTLDGEPYFMDDQLEWVEVEINDLLGDR